MKSGFGFLNWNQPWGRISRKWNPLSDFAFDCIIRNPDFRIERNHGHFFCLVDTMVNLGKASGLEQTRRNFRVPYPFKHFRFLFHVLEICRSFRLSTTSGSDGLDRESDCGSDRTGIFAFSAEELFWEKLFLIMTQVAQNKKSEFLQQESNLWLVQTRLD